MWWFTKGLRKQGRINEFLKGILKSSSYLSSEYVVVDRCSTWVQHNRKLCSKRCLDCTTRFFPAERRVRGGTRTAAACRGALQRGCWGPCTSVGTICIVPETWLAASVVRTELVWRARFALCCYKSCGSTLDPPKLCKQLIRDVIEQCVMVM